MNPIENSDPHIAQWLFTDGSVNTLSKIGYGACLLISKEQIDLPLEDLKKRIRLKKFTETNSTKLELQTLLWALDELPAAAPHITIHTDSQNIVGLIDRRSRLEQADYYSKKKVRLSNYQLYKKFYSTIDLLDCEFIKVKGHQPADKKGPVDNLFALVDRAARSQSRNTKSH